MPKIQNFGFSPPPKRLAALVQVLDVLRFPAYSACLAGIRASSQHFRLLHARRTMITSMLPVLACGQSIHGRTMITSMLPVRASGQSIHGRTMITSMLPGCIF